MIVSGKIKDKMQNAAYASSSADNTDKQKINYQFRVLYAIGIWLIVAGHSNMGGFSVLYEFFPAYSFHLGLFMFASGYFYSQSNEHDILHFLRKKIRKLIIPLYVWNLFYGFLVLASRRYGFAIGEDLSVQSLLIQPLVNGHQFVYNLGGWFVIPLFMVQLFYLCLRKIIRIRQSLYKDTVVLLICFTVGFAGIILSNKGYTYGWKLMITRMMDFLPFYGAGYFYKCHLEEHDRIPNPFYFGIIFALQLLIMTWHGAPVAFTQAWSNYGGASPILVFTVGFLGCALWLRISRILTPIIGKSRIVAMISENAYPIMIHQFLGFMIVKALFAAVAIKTVWCRDFDLQAFRTEPWYYYLPRGLTQWHLVYALAGIILSVCLGMITKTATAFVKNIHNHFGTAGFKWMS